MTRKATRRYILTASLLMVLALIACKKEKNNDPIKVIAPTLTTTEVTDTTVYGVCVEAAMHTIMLQNEKGDTLTYTLETSDTTGMLLGGVYQGDRLAVTVESIDGELFARQVINLKSLQGKWTSIDRNFEMKEDGQVVSNVKAESHPYTSWRILNGQLVLSADTFNILSLGPDSLFLENETGIYAFKRQR